MTTKLDPDWIMEKLRELRDELELDFREDWHVSIRVRFRPRDLDRDRITFSVETEPGE